MSNQKKNRNRSNKQSKNQYNPVTVLKDRSFDDFIENAMRTGTPLKTSTFNVNSGGSSEGNTMFNIVASKLVPDEYTVHELDTPVVLSSPLSAAFSVTVSKAIYFMVKHIDLVDRWVRCRALVLEDGEDFILSPYTLRMMGWTPNSFFTNTIDLAYDIINKYEDNMVEIPPFKG